MVKDKFSFGSNPSMKEVTPGTEARFRFNGPVEIIDTEWGEKYSFPILLVNHPSYETLPFNCEWESKSQVAKELYVAYSVDPADDFVKAYEKAEWQLTRFDTGAYWIDQL